jgi:hypothetical protein
MQTYGQIDSVGSGRAMRFDGVDDMINLGNIYDDLVFPFSVSSWVYFPPGSNGGPIFVSQDNKPVYNGFWFIVRPTVIFIEYGDGSGEDLPNYRRGKSASFTETIGRWMHVCAVVKGINNIELFVNGVNAGGSPTGSSSLPMASQFPNDVAKIGYFLSNGVTYRFSGVLDDIRIFNRALTISEIQRNMTRKSGKSEPGLIGYWTFDEISGNTLVDRSTKQLNGVVSGNPNRIFSGAPIGNENNYLYANTWAGAKVSLGNQLVGNITGNPSGVHIYKVNSMPSQKLGLGTTQTDAYYGVFIADQDITYSYSYGFDQTDCKIYRRKDNSESTWTLSALATAINERTEYILVSANNTTVDFDLGDNKELCDKNSVILETGFTNASGQTFLWNTGATSPSIQVTQTGKYSVTVTAGCASKKDSLAVFFFQTPSAFSFGEDEVLCAFEPRKLAPTLTGEYNFHWQNGSTDKDFLVKTHGQYWLTIENACGRFTDSIRFSKPVLEFQAPNVITPNGDPFNEYFVIQPLDPPLFFSVYNRWGDLVFRSGNYENTWNGSGLPSGIYFYTFTGACSGFNKGTVSILK